MINVKLINKNAKLPQRGRDGDAGLDLYTCKTVIIKPNETIAIPTGVCIELPYGMEGQIRPRSGISLNGFEHNYVRVMLGTIDCNYRGEINIITYNQEDKNVTIPKGTKLAQMIINNVNMENLISVDELSETERGLSGFGSSGTK
ncbi:MULTISPECIES: dUTP diphosphatase [unclassified Clostridium]|uniref:dUTP diphosphatase n=1 Tax=unclassified Clostridium TaxID=2614128 RepID=UPI0013EEC523|nr:MULTISPECIES: dUTP diphosphatase [unclassified Clostridium]MBZ9693230.1 dUTP diphosphatase [Clostridium sp. M14]